MVSSVEGMKVLLLDEETTQIVSTVYSQVGKILTHPCVRTYYVWGFGSLWVDVD